MANPKPLAPTLAEAIGFHDRRYDPVHSRETHGIETQKGHSKVSADPSDGTANTRAATMETSGARYRVHPPVFMPNHDSPAATQANGRIVGDGAVTDYVGHGDYGGGEQGAFDDAAVATSNPPGSQRLRGWTARNG